MTGWAIGDDGGSHEDDADEFYEKLSGTVLPLFYDDPACWRTTMEQAIGHVGYYFNSQTDDATLCERSVLTMMRIDDRSGPVQQAAVVALRKEQIGA